METSTLTTKLVNEGLKRRKSLQPAEVVQIKRPKVHYKELADTSPEMEKPDLVLEKKVLPLYSNPDLTTESEVTSSPELELLNLVNRCLVQRTSFANLKHPKVKLLQKAANEVGDSSGEMLLQIALYARRILNIRSASNFLVAVAARHERAKSFLGRYFDHLIITPSDWLEVAQFNRDLGGTLSNSLRVALRSKFAAFDEYQLQKHNKNRKRNKKRSLKFRENFEGNFDISITL